MKRSGQLSQTYDTLLRGGTVIDGTGAPAYRADLALRGDRIAAMGELDGARAAREFDIQGRCLTPGFIDAHAHDDNACLHDPSMWAKISQGVTTVVVGNCGLSLAPLDGPPALPEPLNLLGHHSDFRFPGFGAYFDAVEEARPATNLVSLVGHNSLRVATMPNLERPATHGERQAMLDLLDEAMCTGAMGLSTGLYYAPGRAADDAEVVPLVKTAARYGGVYAAHVRDEYDGVLDALEEAFAAARAGDAPLVVSHHKCAGPRNWGRSTETLELFERRAAGQDLSLDCYPYEAGSTVLDPALVEDGVAVLITWSEAHPETAGSYLHDIALEWHCSDREAVRRLQPGGACYFQMSDEDVRRILGHPLAMVGSDGLPGDAHPHPRLWGTFPRVIRRYAIEQGLFSLETAVHKMTGMTAKRFRIPERGVLATGHYADLVVFNPDSIADLATYEHPRRAAAGIEYVFVNGSLAGGTSLANPARAGRLLRRRGALE